MTDERNPWQGISNPAVDGELSARRVDHTHPWDFYWAKDFTGNPALLLSHSSESRIDAKRPTLREIAFSDSDGGRGRHTTGLILTEPANRDIFFHLCEDIVRSTREATSESAAIAILVQRTWRWHRMLKGSSERVLGKEEQKGLIGELLFLEQHLIGRFPARNAVEYWIGPEKSPKDFAFGKILVEVKAKSSGSRPFVKISSEHQLDDSDESTVFMYVAEVNASASGESGSFSLTDFVQRITDAIFLEDASALERFDQKLAESGYSEIHDYSGHHWSLGGAQVFEISEGFPRIAHGALPSGVKDVKYSLDLESCTAYRIEEPQVEYRLFGNES